MKNGINVLSLFDGLSCGRIALERAGIHVDEYFASEIDKPAIQIAKKNYPSTIHVGDVRRVEASDFPYIDMVIGGSPCQNFSFAGKKQGMSTKCKEEIFTLERYLELKESGFEFEGESYLFWEFVRVVTFFRPKYFLLENVMMTNKWSQIITNALGVVPIEINSALVSAQNRRRLYWTNIPGIEQPEDKGILLKDILLTDGDPICFSSSGRGNGVVEVRQSSSDKAHTLTKAGYSTRSFTGVFEKLAHSEKALAYMDRKTRDGRNHWDFAHHNESDFDKSRAVTANIHKGVPYNVIIDKRLEVTSNSILNKIKGKDGYFVRKLHPIELERLQTLPDNYTDGVSDTQRYKMIGNGWTADVIVHILRRLKWILKNQPRSSMQSTL